MSEFSYNWTLKDAVFTKDKGKVFSCFACGGGSTMGYKLAGYKADYGFTAPHRTPTKCKNPVFADHYLHRIAIMKDFHLGSKGDIDENGMKGYVSKFICTGCGKKFKINKIKGYFHPDAKEV